MNIFDWFFGWIFPEINLEALDLGQEPLDSLEGLDFEEKQDILEQMAEVTLAIYDPERYPEGAKVADDYLNEKNDPGVNYPTQVQFPQEYLNKQKPKSPPKPRKKITKKKTTKKKKK